MGAQVPFFVPLLNPVAQRLLRLGIPMGPNALLTVRGRKSGVPRTTPVAVVELDGRRWIIGTFGEVNWVQNLRAAGEAVLSHGGRREPVRAVALSPEQAAEFFVNRLIPYVRRVPMGRWLIGSALGARDILDEPDAAAHAHPVFELIPTGR